jgi:hypothetical protein
MLQTNAWRRLLPLLLVLAAGVSFGTKPSGTPGVFSPSAAIAAPVPTPTAGAAALVAATVPNPVPYNFASGTTASSAQINSNFYGLWTYSSNLAAVLNGCGYIPGAAIGAVTLNAPITGSLSGCAANTGTGVTLTLALASPAVFPGAIAAGGAITAQANGGGSSYVPPLYGPTGGLAPASTHSVQGTCAFSASNVCTVALSGAAVFNSASTYVCVGSYGGGVTSGTSSFLIDSQTTTSFRMINYVGSVATSVTTTANYYCSGT